METQLAFSSPFHGEVDRPQGETEGPPERSEGGIRR